jgi:GNAT superfamily N-acetyltransferase
VPPSAVRYQQVFQLTPQTLAPYAGMTFPSLAPGSKRLAAITGELLAVSAMVSGTMVAMAVAERHPDGSASLCSLLVQAPLRRQGIGTRLVAHLQQFLALQGAHRLSVRFTGNAATSASLEPLLARLGWSAPVTHFVLLQGSADKLGTAPWHQRFALSASYTLFPWPQANAADRAAAHMLGAAPELLPPVSDAGIESAVSLGLRHQGQLVGWLIAHRMDATTVRYSCLYVAPGHRSRGQGPALIAEGLQRQQRAGIARAKTAVDVRNPSFLRFCQKHLHPYIDAVSPSRQASVVLPTATP